MNMKNDEFWEEMARLAANRSIVIDRPQGTPHPHYPDMIYPCDYGYLEGITSSDGGGIDVFIGSGSERSLTGILCTFDTIKYDAEIKLLVGCTERDVQVIRAFLGDMRSLYIRHSKEEN